MSSSPHIASYSMAIKQDGPQVLQTIMAARFLAAKTIPVNIYAFSSGSFAVVFKIALKDGKKQAIRCFLRERDIVHRYKSLSDYLKTISPPDCLVDFQFIKKEFRVNNQYHDVVNMEWIDGLPINKYITRNIGDHGVLSVIQQKLVSISDTLYQYKTAHGDLQHGNILIDADGKVKLIDYDNFFTPLLAGQQSLELGRSEYQHPRRTPKDFNETMDWFSYWVMLTALEAVKEDPSLWSLPIQNGYNTLDNFLFTGDDFQAPQTSPLFLKLLSMNNPAVQFYTHKLLSFCSGPLSAVERPRLFLQQAADSRPLAPVLQEAPPIKKTSGINAVLPKTDVYTIHCNCKAVVLSQQFQKIGDTPYELSKDRYTDKQIVVSYGSKTRLIRLELGIDIYNIEFF